MPKRKIILVIIYTIKQGRFNVLKGLNTDIISYFVVLFVHAKMLRGRYMFNLLIWISSCVDLVAKNSTLSLLSSFTKLR